MSLPDSPQCNSDVTLTATSELRHLCPFRDEVDHGRIVITWRVAGSTIELHSLRAYLAGFASSVITHEELTDRIRHDISTLPGLDDVQVSTEWDTAGMEVTCSTSPTLVGLP